MQSRMPLPAVSYVMPVLNEIDYLEQAVLTVTAQNYPGDYELLLILGPSTDGTTELANKLAIAYPRIRLLNNPERDIPIALNLGVAEAVHEIIVRVDAHSELAPGYTVAAVKSLLAHQAANVGGVMAAAGHTETQRAIADCYNSPFGLGGGVYHGNTLAGEAESAYLGVFKKTAWQSVNGFDPKIRRGEDWEFNLRLRQAGYRVWFDPQLQVTYRPRASFGALSKQFFATGVWRAVLVKRYPTLHPSRYFVPGVLVITLVLAVAALIAALCFWGTPPAFWLMTLGAAPLFLYVAGLGYAAWTMHPDNFRAWALRMWTLATMHISWGTGFLRGLVVGGDSTVDRSRAQQ